MADDTQTPVSLSTDTASVMPEGGKSPTEDGESSVAVESVESEVSQRSSRVEVAAPASSVHAGETESSTADLAEIRDTLLALRRDFESKLMHDAGKQRQLDMLHEELETHRRGFHFQVLRPVISDLIVLYTDMDKVAARWASHESHAETAQEIAQFRDQVEEILRRIGVEPYTSQADEFDAKRQRATSTVETTDQANDKRVAARLRPGFEYDGKIVVQPEQVQTYRYVAPVDTGE